MLAQCGSLTSAGIATLADNCGQLKMIDVAFTKVMFQFRMKNPLLSKLKCWQQVSGHLCFCSVMLQHNNAAITHAYILKLSNG